MRTTVKITEYNKYTGEIGYIDGYVCLPSGVIEAIVVIRSSKNPKLEGLLIHIPIHSLKFISI